MNSDAQMGGTVGRMPIGNLPLAPNGIGTNRGPSRVPIGPGRSPVTTPKPVPAPQPKPVRPNPVVSKPVAPKPVAPKPAPTKTPSKLPISGAKSMVPGATQTKSSQSNSKSPAFFNPQTGKPWHLNDSSLDLSKLKPGELGTWTPGSKAVPGATQIKSSHMKKANILSLLYRYGVGITKRSAPRPKFSKRAELLGMFTNLLRGSKKAEDLVSGGKADDKPNSDFPKSEVEQGAKVEREHTSNPQLAREIAKDHLTESTDYYDRLKDMESKMEKDKAASYKKTVKVTSSSGVPSKTKSQVSKALDKGVKGYTPSQKKMAFVRAMQRAGLLRAGR